MARIESTVYDGSKTSGLNQKLAKKDESNLKAVETKSTKTKRTQASLATKMGSESEKPKNLSLAEAAAKMDPDHLYDFIFRAPVWFPDSELLHLVDYFGEALDQVSSDSVQYPWPKMDKLVDVIDYPVDQFPRSVYRIAADYITTFTVVRVGAFILSSFDYIIGKLEQSATPPKSYVGVYVVLSMVLRNKPAAFYHLSPLLRMEPYNAQDKLAVNVWMIAQVARVDLRVAFYVWTKNLLPLAGNKEYHKPESMDLILQLVEYILSYPNARTILVNEPARYGENRFISPPQFEILLRVAFPDSSDRDSDRFKAVYDSVLKELALALSPRTKVMRRFTQRILTITLKLATEGNRALAKEATEIAIWCLTKNVYCFKHWDNAYNENPEASVALLEKLVDEWKDHSLKLASSPSDTQTLKRTMKSFMLKNKRHITEGGANASLYKKADKYSKEISRRLSPGSDLLKGIAIAAVVLVPVVLYSNLVGSFELDVYVNAIATALKH